MINLNSFCEKESCKGYRHICECNQYHIDEEEDLMTDYYQAREAIKQYCQNEDCAEDCKECPYPLSIIRCGEEAEFQAKQKESCENCKYNGNLGSDYPCCHCKRAYSDEYQTAESEE